MNKIENLKFDETYYEETLANGLKVVVWHKPGFKTSSCIFATPYGSLDVEQVDDEGNHIQFPPGIAHFLEHKLFESDHGDAMSDFAAMGCNVNAFTSYQETCYYFDTCAENIDKPLNLLLDFVQQLNITDESVEKEKGIINQELSMYLQMPDSRVILETFKSLYKNHPLKEDIGGTEKTVNSITKDLLEKCYAINYHPQNMMLVVTTPIDPEHIMELVKTNQAAKHFASIKPVKRYVAKEPLDVVSDYKEVSMDVSIDKCCFAIKLPVAYESDQDRYKKDMSLRFSLESHFSPRNPEYQQWIDDKKITSMSSFEEDLGKDYAFLLFSDDTNNPQAFKAFVLEQLAIWQKRSMNKDILAQLKNKTMGTTLRLFNKPDELSVEYFRDYEDGVSIFEAINLIDQITVQDCDDIKKDMDFTKNTLTVIKKK